MTSGFYMKRLYIGVSFLGCGNGNGDGNGSGQVNSVIKNYQINSHYITYIIIHTYYTLAVGSGVLESTLTLNLNPQYFIPHRSFIATLPPPQFDYSA